MTNLPKHIAVDSVETIEPFRGRIVAFLPIPDDTYYSGIAANSTGHRHTRGVNEPFKIPGSDYIIAAVDGYGENENTNPKTVSSVTLGVSLSILLKANSHSTSIFVSDETLKDKSNILDMRDATPAEIKAVKKAIEKGDAYLSAGSIQLTPADKKEHSLATVAEAENNMTTFPSPSFEGEAEPVTKARGHRRG